MSDTKIESINIQSLAGNMGDGWLETAHNAYCEWLAKKLKSIYPGVDIDIEQSDASGCVRSTIVTLTNDNVCPDTYVAEVDAIC